LGEGFKLDVLRECAKDCMWDRVSLKDNDKARSFYARDLRELFWKAV